MKILDNYSLLGHNTFKMDVKCARYIEYSSTAELESLDFDSLPKPIMHIGAGSNLLFTQDFPGTILHSAIKTKKYIDMGLEEVPVMVGSGVVVDEFISETCGYGLWGMENLSLIPGEMGAAAVQNIGAYGVEFKDVVSGVVCYDIKERRKVKFSAAECGYAYRESMFKHAEGRYIVTSILLRLSRAYKPRLEYKGVREALGIGADDAPADLTPMQVRDAIIGVRNTKLPDPAEIGSAGSFFMNPIISPLQFAHVIDVARSEWGQDVKVPHFIVDGGFIKVPAAWMIDRCGLKGTGIGGAAVYERQPLVIVNASGSATPSDVLAVEAEVIAAVQRKFGVTLRPEVEHI
ncbi:MAG: UDP-N-acetylmuramate dehydrogenase [Bacteroidales bacterium]|nr:UDP-N-acetylmuramate dehydrogenase [Bacteroidales bacterium]